jgi:hypothetical protein
MNTSRPQKLVQTVNVTTAMQPTAFVTDSAVPSREKSEPSERKLDSSSERNIAAGDHDTQGGLVNEKNFLLVFPLALLVVFVIFGIALWMG